MGIGSREEGRRVGEGLGVGSRVRVGRVGSMGGNRVEEGREKLSWNRINKLFCDFCFSY